MKISVSIIIGIMFCFFIIKFWRNRRIFKLSLILGILLKIKKSWIKIMKRYRLNNYSNLLRHLVYIWTEKLVTKEHHFPTDYLLFLMIVDWGNIIVNCFLQFRQNEKILIKISIDFYYYFFFFQMRKILSR